jgi:hypothetical protein
LIPSPTTKGYYHAHIPESAFSQQSAPHRGAGLPTTTAKGGRSRPGTPYIKDLPADEFRTVRKLAFSDNENRKTLDLRRSGAVEAINGGAQAETLSQAMGNTLW